MQLAIATALLHGHNSRRSRRLFGIQSRFALVVDLIERPSMQLHCIATSLHARTTWTSASLSTGLTLYGYDTHNTQPLIQPFAASRPFSMKLFEARRCECWNCRVRFRVAWAMGSTTSMHEREPSHGTKRNRKRKGKRGSVSQH